MSSRHGFSFDDAVFAPGIARMLAAAPPGPGARVLDVACGSGVLARRVGGTAGHTTSLDIGRNILKKARSLHGGAVPAAWVRGDAGRLPFAAGSFDRVYCHQGLQFCREPATALREMARVLAPGGRLAALVWASLERCPPYAALARAVAAVCGAPAAAFVQAPFALGERARVAAVAAAGGAVVREVSVDVDLPDPAAFARAFLTYVPDTRFTSPAREQALEPVAARVERELAAAQAHRMAAWCLTARRPV